MFGGGFFGGGSGFGGIPEGFGRPKGNVDTTRYYKLLGVEKNASEAELRKAHRKLALRLHPDKTGGDAEKFKEINQAYDVLRDPEKRKIYDEYGEDAINEGMGSGGGGGGMADIFEMFGGGGGRRQTRERRGENVVHKLKVTLEEMYTGNSRKLSLTRNIKCETCSGAGTKSGRKYQCDVCHGSGVQVMMRPLGPGMMQQIQQPCSSCNQTGFRVPPNDMCTNCAGKGLIPEKKVFEVHVEQGHKHGAKVVLRGEAGCSEPNVQPGDVIFVLEQKPHKSFKRVGNDLVYEKEISLTEALCGTHFLITHLDGRSLSVTSLPGEVIKPDSWKCIEDEGMPVHGSPYTKGNLYVHFAVVFPETVSSEQVEMLKRVLPGPSTSNGHMDIGEAEEVTLRAVKDIEEELRSRRTHGRGANEAYESDSEDEMRGGQRVQCAQQ